MHCERPFLTGKPCLEGVRHVVARHTKFLPTPTYPCAIDYCRSTRLNIILRIAEFTRCTTDGDYFYGIAAINKRLESFNDWGGGERGGRGKIRPYEL